METNQPPSFIEINAYPKNYNIYINSLKSYLSLLLKKYLIKDNLVIIIYDKKLHTLYLPLVENTLKFLNLPYISLSFKATEKNKNIKVANKFINTLLQKPLKRTSTIISLGGGITGDITGFIAAITLRGVNLINIPTTLLAAIDSSIGGKNGINHKTGKNFIGSFYNPNAVIIDPIVFQTLPKRELLAGLAEAIKCSLINNRNFFYYIQKNTNLLFTHNINFYSNILREAIQTKKSLVELDFFDTQNKRVLLNLGHTFGHAIEVINNYHKNLLHGEAVAIGLCMATKFSNYLGLLDKNTAEDIINTIKNCHLPTTYSPLFKNTKLITQMISVMQKDKKNTNNNINLILLKDIGKAILVPNISSNKILNFFQQEYL